MRISIALATYNGEKYLRDQLQSFSTQTLLPDELVVSDDNSFDATHDILRSFAKKAPFEVQILRNKDNLGYSRNFEKSIEKCSGDILFLSDQDDFWFPEKIERMVDRFKSDSNLQLLSCDVEFTDGHLNPTGKTKFENFRRMGIPLDSFVAGCASAFRKEILDICLPIPSRWNYDDWFHAICRVLGTRGIEDSTLQYYRRHGSNTSEDYVNSLESSYKLRIKSIVRTFFAKSPVENDLLKKIDIYKRLSDKVGQSGPKNAIITKMKEDIEVLKSRVNVLQKPLYRRWIYAIDLYKRYGFKRYKVESAIKDSFLN